MFERSSDLGVDEPDKVGSSHTSWIVETISGVMFFKVQGALVVEDVPRRCSTMQCRFAERNPFKPLSIRKVHAQMNQCVLRPAEMKLL